MSENLMPTQSVWSRWQTLASRSHFAVLASTALIAGTQMLSAQNSANQTPGQLAPGTAVSSHRKSSPAHAAVPAQSPVETPVPPIPEPPKWPVNNPAAPPTVRWDSQGLHVEATNSSLRQILTDVATSTGAKVEGLQADERVFGDYGPGPARDVISQILNGSGYNVLMLGDEGQGTPRQIILSERTRSGSTPSQTLNRQPAQDDDMDQPQPEPDEPNQQMQINRPPMMQPMNQPGVSMTPQQRMLELQRQQMEMQQQQQQQQNQNQNQNQPIQPPPQPPD